jgi:hypothetical protein
MYRVLPTPGRYSKFERSFGQPELIAQLTVQFANRPDFVLSSGPNWLALPGPITFSSAYGGEDFDARLEPKNWDRVKFDDSGWSKAFSVQGPGGALIPETTPPIEVAETFTPVKILHRSPRITVYDLGQNFSGWPEIAVIGSRGASVRLLAGELLDSSGYVSQHSANAGPEDPNVFTYTLRGGATLKQPERWHPRFSYYGFRYVQAETSVDVKMVDLRGQFLHERVARIGSFTSSDHLINRIHALIDNAMLSNMVSVLTDCPHREKLGWLEETHLAGTSLNYNWDLSSLYNKMSDDMEDSQLADGLIPSIAPEFPIFSGSFRDSPEWGSAVILSPWVAYQFSGDSSSLREHYDSMRRYIVYLESKAQNNLLYYGLGDWYDIGPGEPGPSKLTTLGLTASAIYYQDLTTLARIAVIAGHSDDANGYLDRAQAVKSAFNHRFFQPDTNTYDLGSQTAQAMPLALGLVPQGHEAAVLRGLVASIRSTNNHVTAGDVGFHYVVRALTDFGRSDILFDMFSRTDPPSYGAQLAAGATSLTEAWDANPNHSQNHFMLGHAEEWFYRGLAGIEFDRSQESDAQIRIRPAIVGTITSASATLNSSLGFIKSGWRREKPTSKTLRIEIEIPERTIGSFVIPLNYGDSITEADRSIEKDKRIQSVNPAQPVSELKLNPGHYRFILTRK